MVAGSTASLSTVTNSGDEGSLFRRASHNATEPVSAPLAQKRSGQSLTAGTEGISTPPWGGMPGSRIHKGH